MEKRFLLLPLLVLPTLLFGVRQFQKRSLHSEFCQPFLAAHTVRVFEQESDFPSKPQPRPRPIATFSGAQFSSFAQVVELKPSRVADGCTGRSNALVFEAVNGQNKVTAGFRLEKQVECGSWLSSPRYSMQWNQKFKNLRLTPASHAALFQLARQKLNWKSK